MKGEVQIGQRAQHQFNKNRMPQSDVVEGVGGILYLFYSC
jgi:hypothetical protein